MPNPLDQLVGLAARVVLRQAKVAAISEPAAGFTRFDLEVKAGWSPGQKVQVRAGGVNFRTLTPFAWDDRHCSLLVHRRGTGALDSWAAGLSVGSSVELFGPRGSLDLAGLKAAPVFVGDETSVALAAAWAEKGVGPAVAQLFEATDPAATTAALASVGLSEATVIERMPDDGHLEEFFAAVVAACAANPGAPIVLSGKAQTIRAIRGAQKEAGQRPTARVKAYWDPSRSALD